MYVLVKCASWLHTTGIGILRMTANQGPNILFFMLNRTSLVLLAGVSGAAGAATPAAAPAVAGETGVPCTKDTE
jgi:hypothetical protein